MAPPDRDEYPRNDDVLRHAGIGSESRLRHNAARLTSWVEWLLHPEEHSYDRTVFHPDGRKQEEPGPVAPVNDQPGTIPPEAQLPFESVLEGYQPWQFLHGMAAVSSPQVERPDSVLGVGAAALNNIWWVGDKRIASLVDMFPTIKWDGDAADAAFTFLLRLQTVAGQVNKLAAALHSVIPKYAVIVKGVRDSLDEAAAGLVTAFENKFSSRPQSVISIDVTAAVLSGIAAATVAYLTAGAALIVEAAVTSAWSALFTDAVGDVLKTGGDAIGGYWWRDLAQSYLYQQQQILNSAKTEIDRLNRQVSDLIGRFNGDPDVQQFLKDYGS